MHLSVIDVLCIAVLQAFGLLYFVTAIYMCAAVGGSTLEAALAVIGAVVCVCGAAALALRCVRPLAAIFTAIALGIAVAGVPLLPQWVTG
ncbi:MAG: hypothetical protein P4L40_25175, partial [Terracidiphilus sp.]|nr:hypothetical protein [Terracidiphilus sp.]